VAADQELIYGNLQAQQQMTFEPDFAANQDQVIGSGQLASPRAAMESQDGLPLVSP